MTKFNFSTLILAGWLMFFSFSAVNAQDEMPVNDAPTPNARQTIRPNLLTELNLTREQIQQIRRVNRANQPLIREAQQRLREAKSNLDEVIYADNSDEIQVQDKLKTLHAAQAEVVRLRSTTEFAVRKILTPEQLVKFREVRRKFMERMENNQNQRENTPFNETDKKPVNRRRQMRNNN